MIVVGGRIRKLYENCSIDCKAINFPQQKERHFFFNAIHVHVGFFFGFCFHSLIQLKFVKQ